MAIATSPTQVPLAPSLPVQRSIGRCALWYILSGGGWALAWLYDTLRELGQARLRDLHATRMTWLLMVPLVNLWVVLVAWREVDAFDRETGGTGFSPALYVALTLLPGGFLFTFPDVQSRLNAAWRRRAGAAGIAEAPLGTLGTVMVGIGVGWMVLVVVGTLALMFFWVSLGLGLPETSGGV